MATINIDYNLFVSLTQTIEHLEKLQDQPADVQREWRRITAMVKQQAVDAHRRFLEQNGYNDGREVAGGVSISPSKTPFL
jgi:hypothetical protein